MPFFAAFLKAAFVAVFAIFTKYLGYQLAKVAILISVFLAMVVALLGAFKLLVAGVASQITNEYLLMVFWVIWPDNADLCISACLGADVAVWVYRVKLQLLDYAKPGMDSKNWGV